MLGPKITTVFKSRWNAVAWCSFVLLTAYCSIPSQGETGSAEQIADLVASAQPQKRPDQQHANPWAKDAD